MFMFPVSKYRAIINIMKKDPAISLAKLAEELKVNPNTLKYRISRLKEKHIIK